MKIGLLDSGIGGLSVLNAFLKEAINAHFFYIADTLHLPYGTKSNEYIDNRMEILSRYLIETCHVDALVIACNTATATSANTLRRCYPNFPVIGIEPAIKPAAEQTKTGHIAIAATHSMILSPRLESLISSFAPHIHVHKLEAGPWVTLVEAGHFDNEIAFNEIVRLTASLRAYPVDQFILGCTHFPFLRQTISEVLGPKICLIDPATAVTRHTLQCLAERGISQGTTINLTFGTTGSIDLFRTQLITLQQSPTDIIFLNL